MNPRDVVRACFLLATFQPVLPASAIHAQKGGGAWNLDPVVTVAGEYDDNVFLFSSRQQTRISAPPVGSPPSRFANMESASDMLTVLDAELEFRGPGFAGRSVRVIPQLSYDRYSRNTERSALEVGLAVAQDLGKGSRARIKAQMTPGRFFKNYLIGAVDGNADGSISTGERLYEPARYAEQVVSADYRVRLKNGRKASPMDVFLDVGAGYYARAYDEPFAVRDQSGPVGTVAATFDRDRMEFEIGYAFALLNSTPGRAVRLLDEPDFGIDFNGNGSTTDQNARAFEMVDYSRTEHEISLRARIPAGTRANVHVDVAHRLRAFGSREPFDIGNNGRSDARNTVGAGLSIRIAPDVRFLGDVELQRQSVNKALDQVGEVADYSRLRTALGLRYTP